MDRFIRGFVLAVVTLTSVRIGTATPTCTIPGATLQGTSCLLASRFYTNWAEAYRVCSTLGCVLAAPENDIKISEIREYAKSVGLNFELYLGGTDSNMEGTFVRAGTGKVLLRLPWADGEPNGNRVENCLMTQNVHEFTMSDTSCEGNMRFICDCTPSTMPVLNGTTYS